MSIADAFLDLFVGAGHFCGRVLLEFFKLAERLVRTDQASLRSPVGTFSLDVKILGGVTGLYQPGSHGFYGTYTDDGVGIHRDILQGRKMARHYSGLPPDAFKCEIYRVVRLLGDASRPTGLSAQYYVQAECGR